MFIYKCDKCNKTCNGIKGKSAYLPQDWFILTHGDYSHKMYYHLCPECRELLKIPKIDAEINVGEHLIDLITEIVVEETQNAMDNY